MIYFFFSFFGKKVTTSSWNMIAWLYLGSTTASKIYTSLAKIKQEAKANIRGLPNAKGASNTEGPTKAPFYTWVANGHVR